MEKIPFGIWVQEALDFLMNIFEKQLRFVSEGINLGMENTTNLLIEVPPYLLILLSLIIIFFIKKSFKAILLFGVGGFLIVNLGYWKESIETLSLVILSTFLSTVIGVPLGIICGHNKYIYSFFRPLLDLMQTIPTFVYLIPTLMLFGLGIAPGLISTIIFAMPAIIRLTYLGITNVPTTLLEVADSFGASSWKKLISVELPYALPTIRTGITQCVMLSLSMVVIAALVGAEGLGKPVVQALNSVNIAKGFESGLSIVIIAILLDRLLSKNKEQVKGYS